jgi:hypothetical protein
MAEISEFKRGPEREAVTNIDEIIQKASQVDPFYKGEIEAILCLAIEVRKLKAELEQLKAKNLKRK